MLPRVFDGEVDHAVRETYLGGRKLGIFFDIVECPIEARELPRHELQERPLRLQRGRELAHEKTFLEIAGLRIERRQDLGDDTIHRSGFVAFPRQRERPVEPAHFPGRQSQEKARGHIAGIIRDQRREQRERAFLITAPEATFGLQKPGTERVRIARLDRFDRHRCFSGGLSN
ncbi:MAG TPA: hypothetical protein VHD34_10850 [Xanthobacteraceae bacterium]|nr:hypothetical protein [Xanthobacteraceae bacterium]